MLMLPALIMLLLSCLTSPLNSEPVKCPEWVKQAGKCDQFIIVVEAANKYSMLLKSSWEIADARYEKKHIIVQIKRGELIGDIDIGEFDNIKKVEVLDGKVVVQYITVEDANAITKLKYFSGGFGFGLVAVILCIILL